MIEIYANRKNNTFLVKNKKYEEASNSRLGVAGIMSLVEAIFTLENKDLKIAYNKENNSIVVNKEEMQLKDFNCVSYEDYESLVDFLKHKFNIKAKLMFWQSYNPHIYVEKKEKDSFFVKGEYFNNEGETFTKKELKNLALNYDFRNESFKKFIGGV